MSSWAVPGAKAIFAFEDSEPCPIKGVDSLFHAELVEGGEYTIRDVLWSGFFREPYILLQEVKHNPRSYSDNNVPYEWGYLLRYFRPPVSDQQKQDVAAIKSMLLPVDELV